MINNNCKDSIISVTKRRALFKVGQRVRKVTANSPIGKIVHPEDVAPTEVERVIALHTKGKAFLVPVEWDKCAPTLELVSLIRDYSVKTGMRVYHDNGKTLRYGKVILRGDAEKAYRAIRYREGEWAIVEWDDGEKQAVAKSELTPVIM